MYSMNKLKSDRKPPLAKSPMRLPLSRVLRSSNCSSIQTPPGSLTKTQKPIRPWDTEESELRPEYHKISSELRALAKMVRNELGNQDQDDAKVANSCSLNSSHLFERGRFYDEYSARRNERLKRKRGVAGDERKITVYNLGVTVESAKKGSSRKIGSLRKSVSAAYSVEQNQTPRYMLRSMTKENKKPPLAANSEKSMLGGEKKIGARRARRI
ncbi:FACT complex subunit like [Quillaja saponaria]|uniref:FACT complex subunit like n=1 Tax=Quillaja saponaria TaxID=32244 RepID=A0AAD7LZ58_QUISA|nr:FACT complex subunit like [Quillaja saponaria]